MPKSLDIKMRMAVNHKMKVIIGKRGKRKKKRRRREVKVRRANVLSAVDQ